MRERGKRREENVCKGGIEYESEWTSKWTTSTFYRSEI